MFYMRHKGCGKAAKVVNFVAKWLNLYPSTVYDCVQYTLEFYYSKHFCGISTIPREIDRERVLKSTSKLRSVGETADLTAQRNSNLRSLFLRERKTELPLSLNLDGLAITYYFLVTQNLKFGIILAFPILGDLMRKLSLSC